MEPKNYNKQIGVALLNFYIWKSSEIFFTFPEKITGSKRMNRLDPFRLLPLKTAMNLLKLTIGWLEDNLYSVKKYSEKRMGKYLYAINLYIFCYVFGGDAKDIDEIDELAENLVNSQTSSFWQNRFADTLGYYYYRRAFLSQSEKEYQVHLNSAITFMQKAVSNAKDEKARLDYNTLLADILKKQELMTLRDVQKKYKLS